MKVRWQNRYAMGGQQLDSELAIGLTNDMLDSGIIGFSCSTGKHGGRLIDQRISSGYTNTGDDTHVCTQNVGHCHRFVGIRPMDALSADALCGNTFP